MCADATLEPDNKKKAVVAAGIVAFPNATKA